MTFRSDLIVRESTIALLYGFAFSVATAMNGIAQAAAIPFPITLGNAYEQGAVFFQAKDPDSAYRCISANIHRAKQEAVCKEYFVNDFGQFYWKASFFPKNGSILFRF